MSAKATITRLRQALEMADLGFHMMRQSLRRKYPNATEAELSEKYAEWISNPPLISGTDLKEVKVRQPSPRAVRRPTRGKRRTS